MEAKIEMYYRCENDIRQILFPVVLNWVNASIKDNDDIKIANTPQELIEDKDILQYRLTLNNETWETLLLQCDDYENEKMELEEEFDNVEVIKILTPNSNDGYDKQWEAT